MAYVPLKNIFHNTVVSLTPHPWLYFLLFQLPETTVVHKHMIFLMYQKADVA